MKYLILLSLVTISGAVLRAQPDADVFEKSARAYAKAVEKEDFEKVLSLTHPKVLKQYGGERKMLAIAKRDAKTTEQKGFTVDKVELSAPLTVMDSLGITFWSIPMRVTVEGPYGKVFSEAGLLGISEDGGKNWTFVSLAQIDMIVLLQLFPEMPESMELPRKQVYSER